MGKGDERKAIVVGASSGIGREVAFLLLERGYTVGVAARREEKLAELKQQYGDKVEVCCIDVTADDATQRLHQLINRLGGMDLYFHASGVGKQNRELQEDIELWTLQTNALGFTKMVGEAYRYFAEHGGGHLAAISSIAGTKGLGPAPAYSATKAFQAVYLQALEQQALRRGLNISITDIRPGFVDTALLAGDFRYPLMLKPEKVARDILKAIEHRRHVVVIDWKYRLMTALWLRLPRWIWRRIPL